MCYAMDAVFRIKASEFNEALFEKIKSLINDRDTEITIAVTENTHSFTLNETSAEYFSRIKKAEAEINAGNTKDFSMEDLKAFIDK